MDFVVPALRWIRSITMMSCFFSRCFVRSVHLPAEQSAGQSCPSDHAAAVARDPNFNHSWSVICGHQTAQTWIQWLQDLGYRAAACIYTRVASITYTNSNSDWLKSGTDCYRTLLKLLSASEENVCKLAFAHRCEILNMYYRLGTVWGNYILFRLNG